MRKLLEKSPKVEGQILLETTYWDSEAVRILSNAPERFVNDRKIQELSPNNSSLLVTLSREEIEQFLVDHHIRLAVFRSRELKQVLQDHLRAKALAHEGSYTIFALDMRQAARPYRLGNKRDG
jgi:hypothetical protein